MSLRVRLALSYLLVIGLFTAVLVGCWLLFTAGLMIGQVERQAEELAGRLRQALARTYADGGREASRQLLSVAVLPLDSRLELRWRDGASELLHGEARPVQEPAQIDRAWGGETAVDFVPHPMPDQRRVSLTIPLVGENDAVVGLALLDIPTAIPRTVRTPFQMSMLKAALAAAVAAFLVGLALSSLIAGPVRELVGATRELGEGRLDRRVPITGGAELAELARSFNEMAGRLEKTLDNLRSEKERVERSEAARREFLADVSHNLRTPLSAIQGWTEALIDGLAPGEEQILLARIHRETLFVSRTVSRLLDLSRWDEAEPTLSEDLFPLSEPLMEAADTLSEAAAEREVSLSFEGIGTDCRIRGDRLRIRELFQIFLENVVEHAGPGTIATVRARTEGSRVNVEIQDNGKGIPGEEIAHLGQRFRRSGGKGAGLGLAIARKLIQAHGGRLQVEAGPAGGTQVSFSLPAA
ncbi:MAG: HAMP domain-containing histidine kinase [Armatimonadetes bacterium]|nr:HAMP domain-containing histidine kinase [Armatimonadota bacterium]